MNTLLIVGLGNPGKEYDGTRHNIGFWCVERLGNALGGAAFCAQKDFSAEMAEARTPSTKILLAKPTTFMNDSGEAVRKISAYYKIPPENVWVIQDEMDLPIGKIRHSVDRGPAGHNGIQSIMDALSTKAFHRIRVGIDSAHAQDRSGVDYVLQTFSDEERAAVEHAWNTFQEQWVHELTQGH